MWWQINPSACKTRHDRAERARGSLKILIGLKSGHMDSLFATPHWAVPWLHFFSFLERRHGSILDLFNRTQGSHLVVELRALVVVQHGRVGAAGKQRVPWLAIDALKDKFAHQSFIYSSISILNSGVTNSLLLWVGLKMKKLEDGIWKNPSSNKKKHSWAWDDNFFPNWNSLDRKNKAVSGGLDLIFFLIKRKNLLGWMDG